MGYLPEWYVVIRAARYLGVAPWGLMKQPAAWLHWALAAENAEMRATETRGKR